MLIWSIYVTVGASTMLTHCEVRIFPSRVRSPPGGFLLTSIGSYLRFFFFSRARKTPGLWTSSRVPSRRRLSELVLSPHRDAVIPTYSPAPYFPLDEPVTDESSNSMTSPL